MGIKYPRANYNIIHNIIRITFVCIITNEKPTLNDIVVTFTNVTQTLANIIARMAKLEIKQKKSKNT